MRNITKDAIEVFWNGGYFNRDNTMVGVALDGSSYRLYLHGHNIALRDKTILTLHSCGWRTTTTKERLNGVLSKLNMTIKQTKGVWRVYDANGDSVPFEDGMTIKL
jgi:hypothetical protein